MQAIGDRVDVEDAVRALVAGDRVALLSDPAILATGLADERGVPRVGRGAEDRLLFAAGYGDLALGRLYEGHVNALQLIGRLGTPEQRRMAERDVAAGRLFATWNTQADDGVRIVDRTETGVRLAGRKTFCSGAPTVARGLITGRTADGGPAQILVADMSLPGIAIDTDFWRPFGMEASESHAVDFTGVALAPEALIGEPGVYEKPPWFAAGAARFVAVHAGGIARLVDAYAAWLRVGTRGDDLFALARLGTSVAVSGAARALSLACVAAWDRADTGDVDDRLYLTVDAARVAVERAGLDVAEAVERGVGARGLLEPEPFSRLLRDLRMYLRQPSPDQAIVRVGRLAIAGTTLADR